MGLSKKKGKACNYWHNAGDTTHRWVKTYSKGSQLKMRIVAPSMDPTITFRSQERNRPDNKEYEPAKAREWWAPAATWTMPDREEIGCKLDEVPGRPSWPSLFEPQV